MARKAKDIIGMRVGKLTVVSLSRIVHTTKHGKPIGYTRYYLCSCDCGGSIVIRRNHLTDKRANVTASCGCERMKYQHGEKWKERSIRPGTAFRLCLSQYKFNAKNRGLSWELSDEQFREITSSPCYYTGEHPSTVKRARSGEEYVYNGIDRLKNEEGYTLQNCVPCCFRVNSMKSDMTFQEFVKVCATVAERIKI